MDENRVDGALKQARDSIEEAVGKVIGDTDAQVEARPLAALLIAGLVGYGPDRLVHRRSGPPGTGIGFPGI